LAGWLTAIVQRCRVLGAAGACLAALCAAADQPQPAERLYQERREAESWLRLESGRAAYREGRPEGAAQEARTLELRLQQQGLADRQQLLQDRQDRDLRRQRERAPGTGVTPAPGVETLQIERRARQMELRNRTERHSWP
jgi:hypothetical protein